MSYAELHCLSNFSFLRGASHPQELVQRAADLGYRALAITDECSMAGVVRAHEAARQLPGGSSLQLIVGAEFRTRHQLQLVLLAANHAAYTQICRLITQARRRSPKGRYQLDHTDLDGLDDCLALWIPSAAATVTEGRWLQARFANRVWLAVELHRCPDDATRLTELLALAQQCGMPAAAAGDVHMHRRARRPLQDVLTATRLGCSVAEAGMRLFPNGERHLRPLSALRKLYPPALLAETLAIAARCQFSLRGLRYEYPPELVPAGCSASEHLRTLTCIGLRQRWPQGTPPTIQEQIDRELALIAELRYEHFFLTVHDVVAYARSRGILCQGRGSAANSAVCYALRITEVDPEHSKLLFERFISRERHEAPDIDVDFENERREEVIQYIYDKYGRERTALAATVICYRGRSARRDVSRALGIDPAAAPPPARARQFAALVAELCGFPRHLSQHVGGFVISGRPLHELVPIENAAMPDRTVIQWDKDDLETLGLLKVDVLALGMLTALRRCFGFTSRFRGWPCRMEDIPPDDAATYDMICRAETIGTFQIESRAQMSMLPRLKPRSYYDLVIEVAIVRPGPIQGGMVHPYLKRREQPESVQYPSSKLEAVLKRTLGVPIFQEQVMQIAVEAADFTPGEADQLRRSMAAWKRKGGLQPFRERLLSGMRRNGYSDEFAERIYQQILGFGEYGFPESHAASFALLTYASCWLKCHEPAAFFAALLNSQPMGFYQPAQLLQEARRDGVTVLPPDVLLSNWDYTLEQLADGSLAIRIGLRQLRGVREADVMRIIAARESRRPADIEALALAAQLSRPTLQALAAGGALHSLAMHRHAAHWQAVGIELPLPLLLDAAAAESLPPLPAPTEAQEVMADCRQLGLSSGRHPLALLRPWLRKQRVLSGSELWQQQHGANVSICGLVTHVQQPGTASGVTFISLEDETGIANAVVWPRVFAAYHQPALQASLLEISGTLQRHEKVLHVVAHRLHDRSGWAPGLVRRSRDFR